MVINNNYNVPVLTSYLVEVRLKPSCSARIDSIRDAIKEYIEPMQQIAIPSALKDWSECLILRDNVEHIQFGDSGMLRLRLPL